MTAKQVQAHEIPAQKIKTFMVETVKQYPTADFDSLDLAIEAQAHFNVVCYEPDCSVPPQLIKLAAEVLEAETGWVDLEA